MAVCPNCGNKTGEGAVFCDQCGTRLPQPDVAAPAAGPSAAAAGPAPAPAGGAVICPSCGAGNVPGEAFCDFCGSPLEAPEPTVEAEPPAEAPAEPEPPAAEPGAEEPAPEPPAAEEPPAPPAEVDRPAAAEPAAPSVEAAMAAGPDQGTCPVCGAAVEPDEAFCATCGASLAQAPIPPEPVEAAEAVGVSVPPQPEPAPELEAALEEAVPPPAPEPPKPEGPATCPACGNEVEPGDAFCSTCGFALQAVVTPPPAAAPEPGKPSAVGPRLVVSASGAEIPLPDKDEILVGREDPVSGIYPDVDLTPHGGEEGGVSRRHARLVRENGKYFVEDLDSTNFTFVNKQKLAPKTRQAIGEGDEIRFGRVAMELRTG